MEKPFLNWMKITILNPLKCIWTIGFISCMICLMTFPSMSLYAQDIQVWLEADIHKDLGKSWKYKAAPNFRKYFENSAWHRYGIKNTFSRKIRPWLSGEINLDFFYTHDEGSADIGEIRPSLAGKLLYPNFIKAIRLEKPYIYLKLEERFLWYPSEDKDDQKTRLRLKGGGTFILNDEKITDETFYIPWYVEGFHSFDGEAFEHYAYNNRLSIGLGYVFNKQWRGEFDYILQGSRNTLEDGYIRADNIFQLKVDYFID